MTRKRIITLIITTYVIVSLASCKSAPEENMQAEDLSTKEVTTIEENQKEDVEPETEPEDTSEPEKSDEPEDYSAAYSAYLDILQQENTQAITSYWYPEKQVALYDIYGDSTPELLYITRLDGNSTYQAMLNIYTFQKSDATLLYSDVIDIMSGGTYNFCLFTITGEKSLYIHNGSYNETTRIWYNHLVEKADKLIPELLMEHKTYLAHVGKADEFQYDGSMCAETDYNTQVSDLIEKIDHIIWYNGTTYTDTGKYQEQLCNATIEDEAMSYQAAISFLGNQLGITIQPDQFATSVGNWVSNGRFGEIDRANGVYDTLQITEVIDGRLLCNISFYRLMGFDFVGTIDSENHATLYAADSDIHGELVVNGEQITVTFEDKPNVYFDSSLSEFIGLQFTFTRSM